MATPQANTPGKAKASTSTGNASTSTRRPAPSSSSSSSSLSSNKNGSKRHRAFAPVSALRIDESGNVGFTDTYSFSAIRSSKTMTESEVDLKGELLVCIVDLNPFAWAAAGGHSSLTATLGSLPVLWSAHLLAHRKNRLAVLATTPWENTWIVTGSALTPSGADYTAQVNSAINALSLLASSPPPDQVKSQLISASMASGSKEKAAEGLESIGSLLGGALSMALCYIAVAQRGPGLSGDSNTTRGLTEDGVFGGRSTALARTAGGAAAAGAGGVTGGSGPSEHFALNDVRARVLVVTSSPDVPGQYIPVMNSIFASQKALVPVDALVIRNSHSSFLQQASDLTGGHYASVSPDKAAEPDLMGALVLERFFPDTNARAQLKPPPHAGVDYRASCFCHKKPVDVGYVCSVCLSIFCRFTPVCSTCGVKFEFKRRAPTKQAAAPTKP